MRSLSVKRRAEAVGTLRFVSVFLMETLAAWVPSTPEMEVKVLFGRHLWRMAQQADALGLRTRELRAPLHHSVAPTQDCLLALRAAAAVTTTNGRIEAFYQILLGALLQAYGDYLDRTDRLIDEPTVVICEAVLRDIDVMRAERSQVIAEFPSLKPDSSGELEHLRAAFAGPAAILPNEAVVDAGKANVKAN